MVNTYGPTVSNMKDHMKTDCATVKVYISMLMDESIVAGTLEANVKVKEH